MPFLRGEDEGTPESHSFDAPRAPVSNDPRDVKAFFQEPRRSISGHNRVVLQDRFQSAVVPGSHVTV
jgi:hypothetical protein